MLPAVAEPETRVASAVLSALKLPPWLVLQRRSAAGLFARAGAPGEVFVPDQSALEARTANVHGALALTVKVGPVVELNPASKSVGVGAVRAVEPALT
jgi:hypothetical protein